MYLLSRVIIIITCNKWYIPHTQKIYSLIAGQQSVQRDSALKLKDNGMGYGGIAKALGLKNRFHARRLLEI